MPPFQTLWHHAVLAVHRGNLMRLHQSPLQYGEYPQQYHLQR
ncbi:Uncharacterised protein [Vibrio cholerae]|nr:Uncharacterised protein [Vibrio cholerae]